MKKSDIPQTAGFYWVLNDQFEYEMVRINHQQNIFSTSRDHVVDPKSIFDIFPSFVHFSREHMDYFNHKGKCNPEPKKTPQPIKKRRRLLQ